MTKEEEIQKNMTILKISREEAEQLYIDDHSDVILPEVAEMEQKAKQLKRRYEKSLNPRKPSSRKPALDEEKCQLINFLQKALEDDMEVNISNIEIKNPQKEIVFSIGENNYSISLIKHRPPKKS